MIKNFSVLITGDFVINQPYDISRLNKEVIDLFQQSDLNITNLEAPVTSSASKISKTGPHLKADKEATAAVMSALNISVATLANNHILDYDEQGVHDTMAFCKEKNIHVVGAGKNMEQASETLYIDTAIGKIAIVNFAENEWASAQDGSAGANPMDTINNFRQIKTAKANAKWVIVIVHGGNEYNPYPSPRMVKQYRFYAENGADAVVGHHTHCVGGFERHQGVPIFYSLGNFLFTTDSKKRSSWYTGLVLKLKIQSEKEIEFEIIPVSQAQETHQLAILKGSALSDVHALINLINTTLADKNLLNEKWEEFVKQVSGGFIKTISPLAGFKNKRLIAALYKLRAHKLFMHKTYIKEALNRIRCEAHFDVTIQLLKTCKPRRHQ